MEDVNKRRRIFFSLSKLECAPQEINSREIRLHLSFSANWNKRAKIEKTGIHFKTDVFAAVAVVDAKAAYLRYIVIRQKQNILGANWIAPADSIPNVFSTHR